MLVIEHLGLNNAFLLKRLQLPEPKQMTNLQKGLESIKNCSECFPYKTPLLQKQLI